MLGLNATEGQESAARIPTMTAALAAWAKDPSGRLYCAICGGMARAHEQ
jgi:hypothetical protein